MRGPFSWSQVVFRKPVVSSGCAITYDSSRRIRLGACPSGRIDPSDIVQQTLMEAFAKRDQFRGTTSEEHAAWLRRILARNVADALRAQGRQKRDVSRERSLEQQMEESSARLGDWLAREQATPQRACATTRAGDPPGRCARPPARASARGTRLALLAGLLPGRDRRLARSQHKRGRRALETRSQAPPCTARRLT